MMETPAIKPLAPDVQRLLQLTRWVPALDRLPLALARWIYTGAARLCNPPMKKFGRISRKGSRLTVFEPVIAPDESRAFFFIHGGGWTLGSPDSYQSFCSWLAARTGARVYALDYRRAPEHPYPAAIDDCLSAYRELRRALPKPTEIHLVGDSAGGQLSLNLCYHLREAGETQAASLMLHYPVVTSPDETGSYETFADGLFLTRRMMKWFWQAYQPRDQETAAFALRWQAWDWLPPISLCLARHDVLFDEGYALARILDQAGVLHGLHIEEDLPHAYINFMRCPSAMAALERQIAGHVSVILQTKETP